MFRDISEVICGLAHVQGVADEHFFIYTGDSMLYSIRVLADEGCEVEVKNMVEELLVQLGITDCTVDVTSTPSETEFRKVSRSGLTIESVVSQYIHDHHDHECDHHHHEHDHEHEHDHHHEHEHEHHHDHEYDHDHHDDDHYHGNHQHCDHDHDHLQPLRAHKLLISSGKLD